jgi:hypothetical protein
MVDGNSIRRIGGYMKKLISYALCGLFFMQATSTSTFNVAQTWNNMSHQHKRWIRIAGWSAMAVGTAYLAILAFSCAKSEYKKIEPLSVQAHAIRDEMLPKLIEDVRNSELAFLKASNDLMPHQQTLNDMYIKLQNNRNYLTAIMDGRKLFDEEARLYSMADPYPGMVPIILATILSPLGMLTALCSAYDAYCEKKDIDTSDITMS